MKAIKFIFAFSLFFMALTSCTSDSISVDEALYTQDTNNSPDLFATGGEGAATYDNSRN